MPLITSLGADDDLRVRVYPHDVIGRYIYIDGVFEPASWDFVKRFVKPAMTVFDLGANLGQYTLLAAKCIGSSGQVHSFEPSSRMFEELRFNVSLNGFSERCTLNNAAVSNAAGYALLAKCAPGNEVYASLGNVNRPQLKNAEREEVKVLRLDDYVSERRIDHVDFMKIDIEGAELLALKGAERLLSRNDAPTILLEMADINTDGFGYKAVEAWDFLTAKGYHVLALDDCRAEPHELPRPSDFRVALNVVATKKSTWS